MHGLVLLQESRIAAPVLGGQAPGAGHFIVAKALSDRR